MSIDKTLFNGHSHTLLVPPVRIVPLLSTVSLTTCHSTEPGREREGGEREGGERERGKVYYYVNVHVHVQNFTDK